MSLVRQDKIFYVSYQIKQNQTESDEIAFIGFRRHINSVKYK